MEINDREAVARIHSLESFATLDGIGIRFDVFLQGCPLRCWVCHNPDTWEYGIGRECTAGELVDKIKRYKPYFRRGGGVTVSGGEPLGQSKFLISFFRLLRQENINIAIDTSGAVWNDDAKEAMKLCNMVILDLKFPTEEMYKKYARGSLKRTLEVLDYAISLNKEIWIRTVVIPEINDSKEMISKYCELLKGKKIAKYELLGFHTMGFFKYEDLGINNPLKDTPALNDDWLKKLQEFANNKLKELNEQQ